MIQKTVHTQIDFLQLHRIRSESRLVVFEYAILSMSNAKDLCRHQRTLRWVALESPFGRAWPHFTTPSDGGDGSLSYAASTNDVVAKISVWIGP